MAESGARPPAVSVIVPVYNGEATIAACVESLLALDHPRERTEITVVDNRSTDRTRAILRGYPIRVLAEDDVQSSYAARNRGIAASTAEYLAFTDADCIVDRGWLGALLEAIEPEDVGSVAGAIEALRAQSAIERYQAARALRADRAFGHAFLPFAQTANAAYKRAVFEQVGLFDPAIVYGGDLDLSWRMQRQAGLRLVYAPPALVLHQHRTSRRGLFKLYEKNAIANCLLAGHYDHYAAYPGTRTLLYLAREAARSALQAAGRTLRRDADRATLAHLDAIRYAGEAWGWLRWRCGGGVPRALRPAGSAPRPAPRLGEVAGGLVQEARS